MSFYDRARTGGSPGGNYKRHLETEELLKKWLKDQGRADPIKLFRACLAEDEFEEWSLAKAKMIAFKYNFSDEFIADEIRPYKYHTITTEVGPLDINYHTANQLKWDTFWGHEERTRRGLTCPDDHKPKTDPTDPVT